MRYILMSHLDLWANGILNDVDIHTLLAIITFRLAYKRPCSAPLNVRTIDYIK